MMMLRRRMWRRRTDPKTGNTLSEPAQSKRTWTFCKSHVASKFSGAMPDPNPKHDILCEPANAKRTWAFHKSHVVWKFIEKNAGPQFRGRNLESKDISQEPCCVEIYKENAGPQSRAKHFVRVCGVEAHMDISQEPCCVDIYRENSGPPGENCKNLSVWPHYLGNRTKHKKTSEPLQLSPHMPFKTSAKTG